MRRLAALVLAAHLLAGCSQKRAGALAGYVEGERLMIASQDGGVLAALYVAEGDRVAAGAPLFRIAGDRMALDLEQAERAAAAAAARVADDGSLAEAVADAEAQYENARRNYERSRALKADGVLSAARLEADRAAHDGARARLQGARAARDAAQREAESAAARVALWRLKLAELEAKAPAAGSIERIYRRPGELLAPGDPALALLPPDNLKVRFFAPAARLGEFALGREVKVSCAGCRDGLAARVSFVAGEPQFTPPIIYSLKERDRLVFLIEARLPAGSGLTPGAPVDVAPVDVDSVDVAPP